MFALPSAHGWMGQPRNLWNGKESGSRAGLHRPCLQREGGRKGQATARCKIPCQALHSLSQAKAKTQLPLLGTARRAQGDTGRHRGSTAASQHPGSKGGQGLEKSKLCLPAQAQGQMRAQRETENTGTTHPLGLCGDWQLSWFPGHVCTTQCKTSWEQPGAWAGALEAGEPLPQPCA